MPLVINYQLNVSGVKDHMPEPCYSIFKRLLLTSNLRRLQEWNTLFSMFQNSYTGWMGLFTLWSAWSRSYRYTEKRLWCSLVTLHVSLHFLNWNTEIYSIVRHNADRFSKWAFSLGTYRNFSMTDIVPTNHRWAKGLLNESFSKASLN